MGKYDVSECNSEADTLLYHGYQTVIMAAEVWSKSSWGLPGLKRQSSGYGPGYGPNNIY